MNSERQLKNSSAPAKLLKPGHTGAGMICIDAGEKGFVLIAAIGILAILAVLGTVGALTTNTEIKISSNYKTSTQSLYAAQAGAEEARARLRGASTEPIYAGDPAVNPDQTWSAYILGSSTWQTTDDPDYDGTYKNYIPTTSSHTNTVIKTNTIQKSKGELVPVTWVDTVGVTVNGNSITKNASSAWGNGGAASLESFTGDGGVEFTATQTDTYRMVGLSKTNPDPDYTSIEYAIYLYNSAGLIQVREYGGSKGEYGSYQTGDRFAVERIGSTIVYKKNDAIFYTSATPTNSALFFDCAIHTDGGEISDVKLTESDIKYWVKIRHKRVADVLPFEFYQPYGITNDIIYFGYATPTSTVLEQFTTDGNPPMASPVEIITSYGSSRKSSSVIEIQARRATGPPVVSALYADSVAANGNVDVNGDDACYSSDSVPAVGYTTDLDLTGGAIDLDSAAGPSIQIIPALDVALYVDQMEPMATIIWDNSDDPLQNVSVGSPSNYVIVYCDATQLSDQELDINNLTGYGTLLIRGDGDFTGNLNWQGLIIASGDIILRGGGSKEIYGAVLASDVAQLSGNINVNYDSCEIKNARGAYKYTTFRWEDKKLNQ